MLGKTMLASLTGLFFRLTLGSSLAVLIGVAVLVALAAYFAQGFKLDASPDSLVLENDADLRYYREVRARYGSDDFLVVTYSPFGDLMSDAVLADIGALRDALADLPSVAAVTSLLDVPLIDSPRMTLAELREEPRTLETPGTDRELARRELTQSPLYRDLILSADGRTTAIQVNFARNERHESLLERREELRLAASERELTTEEAAELDTVSEEFRALSAELQARQQAEIAAVRAILDQHRDMAKIHLGGVPMITSDMIDFVRSDIRVFGTGVALLLVALLAVAFKRPRWVLIPMLICGASTVAMLGLLGLLDWPVTVVSSNFISLMLITALALAVHLIVRFLELEAQTPGASTPELVEQTVRSKFLPALYTALTTQVAFASLIISDIRPVIDFGWMMVAGVGLAFVLCFLLFPAITVRLPRDKPVFHRYDLSAAFTHSLAQVIARLRTPTLWLYGLLLLLALAGLFRLSVENRFIDYFKDDTEIYRGMLLIDRELGGTMPLDLVLDPPRSFVEWHQEQAGDAESPGDALYGADASAGDSIGISGESYWFNMFELGAAERVEAYLDALPETGKVLSVATTMTLVRMLNNDEPLDNITLAVMYKRLPEDIRRTLFDPYMSDDGNQLRFAVRVVDSYPGLDRGELIARIRSGLVQELGLEPEQVHLSGMLILYNNVLASLFRSQILTMAVVFLAIAAMLLVLFRNWKLAAIGVVPTMLAAILILGTMGWFGIPLDIMTITIAAITIGIGVDNSIHYIHRVQEEFALDGDYRQAVARSHASVGRAIYYTSIIVTLGFSILVLSNFIPTIYFGLLTGLAMLIALIANLTLLPLLIVELRPLGTGNAAGAVVGA